MVRSQEQKDRAKDKRLQREFGITLANHDDRRVEQNNKCKICSGALDAYGPAHTDHYHFKMTAFRNGRGTPQKWTAETYDERGQIICQHHATTKMGAICAVKRETMPWAIRGLLCARCNRGLGYIERFFGAAHNPEILLWVYNYLSARLKKS